MSFSKTVQWWQEWQLRILALSSLFLQYFLFMSSLLRKRCIPSWVRFFIWLAYLGSDAMALYALATLFNYPKQMSLGVKVLWAPILLVHLGGQDLITAYNIEDNELWKRHVLTAMSQVIVAVYVFWKSWSEEKREEYLTAASLLFFPGILKCILKPWDLKRVSINSLMVSSRSEENGEISSLNEYIQAAMDYCQAEHRGQSNENGDLKPDDYLFVDLAPSYSARLKCLKHVVDAENAHKLLKRGLSAKFDRFYTKESVLHENFSSMFAKLFRNFIDLLRVLGAGCMLAVLVLVPINQGGAIDTDVRITYILLSCTAGLEYLIPAVIFNRLMNQWIGKQQQWPDHVSQYNIIWYLARNKKCKTKTIRKLATLLVCKDFLDQHWCMPSCKSSSNITNLVHVYLKEGWTHSEHQITDMSTYRAFNDNRGQWTLEREGCGGNSEMAKSLQKPFDESVVLWHLATDFCFYRTLTALSPHIASRSRGISNYMAYLLFVNPEMLMTGARPSLFRTAYRKLKETLKMEPQQDTPPLPGPSQQDTPPLPDGEGPLQLDMVPQPDGLWPLRQDTPPQADGTGPSQHNTPREHTQEREFAQKIADNIRHAAEGQDLSIVHDAWRLAEGLLNFRSQHNEEKMWKVIQGVWVEMLCFSAGRCRGYLHAKSLGQGGEYLSYIWLLLSYMGMETLAERMQRTNLQEDEAGNNGANATTEATQVTARGGHGNVTTAASPTRPNRVDNA